MIERRRKESHARHNDHRDWRQEGTAAQQQRTDRLQVATALEAQARLAHLAMPCAIDVLHRDALLRGVASDCSRVLAPILILRQDLNLYDLLAIAVLLSSHSDRGLMVRIVQVRYIVAGVIAVAGVIPLQLLLSFRVIEIVAAVGVATAFAMAAAI